MRHVSKIFLFLAWAGVACTQTKFDGKTDKTSPSQGDLTRCGPNEAKLTSCVTAPPKQGEDGTPKSDESTECTKLAEQECRDKKKDEGTEQSHRVVDCADKAKDACADAIKEEKGLDGDIGSEIRVKNCKDFCDSLRPLGISVTDGTKGLEKATIDFGNGKVTGLKVEKVGVNFEDLFDRADSDRDYNDAVLCFEGGFLVDKSRVHSLKAQTVTASTYSNSGCEHEMTVDVVDADGTKASSVTFGSRDKTPRRLTFKKGSQLEVYMRPTKGGCTKTKVDMHGDDRAIVKPNVCNTTGH